MGGVWIFSGLGLGLGCGKVLWRDGHCQRGGHLWRIDCILNIKHNYYLLVVSFQD